MPQIGTLPNLMQEAIAQACKIRVKADEDAISRAITNAGFDRQYVMDNPSLYTLIVRPELGFNMDYRDHPYTFTYTFTYTSPIIGIKKREMDFAI